MAIEFYSCPKCGRDKLLNSEVVFSSNLARSGKVRQCKECRKTQQAKNWQEYYSKNKERLNKGKHQYRIQDKFGITIDQYNEMFNFQLGGCAICKQPCESGHKLSVDHNHKTLEVRGLLCYSCNAAIGMLKENEDIIWNMLEYLKRTTWTKKSA